jgi:hypothetical protein
MQPWLDRHLAQQRDQQLDQDFHHARWRARRGAVRGWLRRRPSRLLSLREVRTGLAFQGQHDRGLQAIPLDRIVGSEGRTADFDRRFLPRREHLRKRWQRIGRARYEERSLPPIEVVQVGALYFVRDGNHRMSVARQNEQDLIDAHVVELTTNVALPPDLDAATLVQKAAQSHFLADTHLLEARPGAVIPLRASDPATYAALHRHIAGHRYFLGLDEGRPISAEEAVAHWYDAVYLPQVEAMRQLHTCVAFPQRTETSLFLVIMEHRHYLTERASHDPGPKVAVLDFMAQYGPWCARWRGSRWGRIARRVLGWLRTGLHAGWQRLRPHRPA